MPSTAVTISKYVTRSVQSLAIGNLLAALRAAYYEPVPVEWHNQNKQARGKKEKNLFYSFIDKTLNSNLKKNWSKLRDHWPRPDSSTVGSDNNTINRLDRWESVSWIISLLWKESTEGLLVRIEIILKNQVPTF